MSLWLDVLEGFSALFIDPLKLLSLIVKFSFHLSALTLWIFPCLLAIFLSDLFPAKVVFIYMFKYKVSDGVCGLYSCICSIINMIKHYLSKSHSIVVSSDMALWKRSLKGLLSACLSFYFFCLFQSYIHGSSQAQFVAESHIILLLNILSHKTSLCTIDLPHCSVNEVNCNNLLTSYRSVRNYVIFWKCRMCHCKFPQLLPR